MVKEFVYIGLLICYVSADIKLPAEPSLPTKVCSTITAELKQTAGHLPDTADASPDTKRIQEALNKCTKTEAVRLIISNENNAFISAPLTLPSGVTLWIDKSVTLFASRNPRDFDTVHGNITCGVKVTHDAGCSALITATDTKDSGVVGDGIIDGRGGSMLIGQNKSWWDIALDAKNSGGKHNNPRLIQINKGNNFLLYRITMNNSPHYHVVPSNVDGFIAWGVKLHTPTTAYPKYNDTNVKNTDGIDPAGSSNVVIAYSYISTGDDNIAIKSDSGPSSNILIAHNHFYKGHGMSIGSGTSKGVSNVIVRDLSLDGTVTGLQIKSDSTSGGLVTGITYEQICIRNVDSPLVFNAYYSNNTGSSYPDFQDIRLSGVHILSSNKQKTIFRGYDAKHPLKITLDHVVSDVLLNNTIASDALITDGNGAVTNASKESVLHLIRSSKELTPIDCSKAFPSFPN